MYRDAVYTQPYPNTFSINVPCLQKTSTNEYPGGGYAAIFMILSIVFMTP